MNYAFRSVARSGRITAVVLAAVAAMTVFLSAFAGGIAKNRAELDRLCETMTVTAGVTGYRDAPTASLSQEQYGKIMDSGFVRTKSAMIQKTVNDTCALRAMDSMELEPELLGWAPYITWAEGWDAEKFFAGEAVCLVPRACEVALGATFSFRLGGGKKLPPLEMRVVGLYGEAYGSARNAVFYCPLAAMETWLGANGEKIVYNKLEMELQDLRHLDTFKQEMKAAGLDKGSSQLVIHDALFQRVTRQFRQQIRLMNTLSLYCWPSPPASASACPSCCCRGGKRRPPSCAPWGCAGGRWREYSSPSRRPGPWRGWPLAARWPGRSWERQLSSRGIWRWCWSASSWGARRRCGRSPASMCSLF